MSSCCTYDLIGQGFYRNKLRSLPRVSYYLEPTLGCTPTFMRPVKAEKKHYYKWPYLTCQDTAHGKGLFCTKELIPFTCIPLVGSSLIIKKSCSKQISLPHGFFNKLMEINIVDDIKFVSQQGFGAYGLGAAMKINESDHIENANAILSKDLTFYIIFKNIHGTPENPKEILGHYGNAYESVRESKNYQIKYNDDEFSSVQQHWLSITKEFEREITEESLVQMKQEFTTQYTDFICKKLPCAEM